MKETIKNILISIIGYRNTNKLKKYIKGEKATFSENDLIFEHFFNEGNRKGTMVDVGVHYGESAIPFFYEGWSIYGFEPDPENRKKIPLTYPQKRLKIFHKAVSDKLADAVPFFASEESTGISSLASFTDTHVETATVEVTTLEKVCTDENIKSIDYLKIDTEGYDFFVLKGYDWEGQSHPSIIQCEFENAKTLDLGYDYTELGNFLISKGYKVLMSEWYPIEKYGISHSWRALKPFPCKLADEKGWGNFIAYKDDRFTKWVDTYLEAQK